MSDIDLEAIEARANAATPGPWRTPEDAGNPYRAPAMFVAEDDDPDDPRPILDHEGQSVWPWEREADMVFAYAARTDVPALIAEVRSRRAENERLTKERDEARRENEGRETFIQGVLDFAEVAGFARTFFGIAEAFAERRSLEARLNEAREALDGGTRLVLEMDTRMPDQATHDENGWIKSYRIPVGPWHRLLAWAQSANSVRLASLTDPEGGDKE